MLGSGAHFSQSDRRPILTTVCGTSAALVFLAYSLQHGTPTFFVHELGCGGVAGTPVFSSGGELLPQEQVGQVGKGRLVLLAVLPEKSFCNMGVGGLSLPLQVRPQPQAGSWGPPRSEGPVEHVPTTELRVQVRKLGALQRPQTLAVLSKV